MDVQFSSLFYRPVQIDHHYGPDVHILKNPLQLSLLSRLCSAETKQPDVTRLVLELYHALLCEVLAAEFPRVPVFSKTRMFAHNQAGVWQGEVFDPSLRAVVVSLARAGLVPSQFTYDFLNHMLPPDLVRQDHLALARTTNDKGHVMGADLYSSKIGGSIDGSYLLIPDPMGATGSTVFQVLEHYREGGYGTPSKVLALHLIITPEYIRFMKARYPKVKVYALRLDRGLSSEEVLQTIPGTHPDKERGLTDDHYIIPGAGGLGEVLNNSFV